MRALTQLTYFREDIGSSVAYHPRAIGACETVLIIVTYGDRKIKYKTNIFLMHKYDVSKHFFALIN